MVRGATTPNHSNAYKEQSAMIFIENKYYHWYCKIVEKAKNRITDVNCEKHHILPRSLGGSNDTSNIVSLTTREHFLCHILLTKCTSGLHKEKMIYAANMMSNFKKYNSKVYAILKEEHRKLLKSRCGENHPSFGRKDSQSTIQKRLANTDRNLLKSQLGKKGENHPAFGRKWSEEDRKKISKRNKGKKKPEGFGKGEKNSMYGRTGDKSPMFGKTGDKNPMFGKTGTSNPSFLKNLDRFKAVISMLAMNKSIKEICNTTGFCSDLINRIKKGNHYICKVDLNAF